MGFKTWMAENFNYVSIGHNFDGKFDAWVLLRGNVVLASDRKEDPEFFHDKYVSGQCKGRIDHDNKIISVTYMDEEDKPLVKFGLKDRFPGYKIFAFRHGGHEQI
jgi:hypothetical protein